MYNSENLRWYRQLGKNEKKIVKEYLLELYIDRFDVTKELVKIRPDGLMVQQFEVLFTMNDGLEKQGVLA